MHIPTLKEIQEEKIRRGLMVAPPLWSGGYEEDSAETAFRFLTECCWTFNEANPGPAERIPPHDYVRAITYEWHQCRVTGRPLILEKSRRMIVSWVMRGLELWRLGLRTEVGVIAGLTYPKAAEHVWRIYYLYNAMRRRRPEFQLEPCRTLGGNVSNRELERVILPNGSTVEVLNQDGAAFQGSGYSFVTMEEFSIYKNCEYMWAQAKRVTEGKPGYVGGSVVIVTNASPNKQWKEVKRLARQG